MVKHMYTAPTDNNRPIHDFLDNLRLPFDSAALLLIDPMSDTLIPLLYQSPDHSTLLVGVPSVKLGSGSIGEAAARRCVIRIDDLAHDPRGEPIDPAAHAALAIPLLAQDELLGVLNLEHHTPSKYQPDDEARALASANQLALLLKTLQQNRALLGAHNYLVEQAETRRRDLAALQRLATITSATADLDDMLTNALRETAELLNCEGAQILLPDHSRYHLERHTASLFGVVRDWPSRVWALDGPGLLIDSYHMGEAHYNNEPLPAAAGITCYNELFCPLNTRQRTLGILNLVNRRSGDFTDEHMELAETIARQIAVSMSSAQKLVTERHRTELLNQISRISQELFTILNPGTLLLRTAEAVRELLPHEAVYIVMIEEDSQLLRVKASSVEAPMFRLPDDYTLHISQGIVGRAIRTRQTQIVPDLRSDPDYVPIDSDHRLQSNLTVTLRRTDEALGEMIVGVIGVMSTQINAFGEIERDALETLATQVSTALENARLYHQMQRRLLEQNVVYQIGQDLTAILDLRTLCNAIVQHMNRAMDTTACLVELYEPAHRTVRVEADYRAEHHSNSGAPPITGAYLALDEHYAIAEAIRTQQPVTIYADMPSAPPEALALLEDLGDYSQLVIPMVAANTVIGTVEWLDQAIGRRFTEDDLQLGRTLVAQATIAIQNALLFTELEKHARELFEANQLRSQFLAVISHELRTPMNSIIGFSETLMEGLYGDLNEKQASRMERIRENGYTLLSLIDDLLDLSKIDAGHMTLHLEQTHINGTISTVIQMLEQQAATKGLDLVANLPDNLPPVNVDPQRLAQIVTNLLSNAIKFTHEGSITVEATVVTRQDRQFVQASVTDTGIGISKSDQAFIFDEFRQVDSSSTRAYGGTGMGLAITRRFVEAMNGSIWVESELGKGSTFIFTLPAAD